MEPLSFTKHDHGSCIKTNIDAVVAHCKDKGLQFTALRRRVLEILLAEHRAIGAYHLLNKLHGEGLGSHPPVAYRSLDFLVNNGFAHKIKLLSAFIACSHPGENHEPAFLICRICNTVAEVLAERSSGNLGHTARSINFKIERRIIEVEGICPNCRKQN